MKFAKSLWTRQTGHLLAAAALAVAASSASAASTWNTTSACTGLTSQGATQSQSAGNLLTCTGSTNNGVTLYASSFSTTNGATSTTGTVLQAAATYNWGGSAGLGTVNKYEDPSATGPHAIDNQYGTDMLLLSFSQAVDLASIGLGWTGSDKDFSILVWTGTGAPTLAGQTLTGLTNTAQNPNAAGTLLSSGWKLVSNYGNSSSATITNDLYSSYWLVSAYNTSFGTTSADNSTPTASTTNSYDAFKVLTVAANTCTGTVTNNICGPKINVPEPGSLALMGVALIGLIGTTRRRAAKQA